jgi:hypothetical protein
LNDAYEVWTGDRWSTTKTDAIRFASLDAADEYVRDHGLAATRRTMQRQPRNR